MTDAQSAQPSTPDDVPHAPTVPAQALPPMPASSPQADTDTTAAPEPEPAADTTTEPTAAPKPGRRRTILTALAGAAAGAALVGTIWAVTANTTIGEPDAFTLTGEFALTEGVTEITGDESACQGDDGYDDIQAGTSVTVYDAAGTTVATGSIGTPKFEATVRWCVFDVNVPDVPKGSKFYSVEISHRGKVQLTAEEAEAGKFTSTLG